MALRRGARAQWPLLDPARNLYISEISCGDRFTEEMLPITSIHSARLALDKNKLGDYTFRAVT